MRPVFCIVYITLLFAYANANTDAQRQTKGSQVEQLNEDNWDLMLTGEWMVEFYAPWCPACKALEPIWENLALSKKDLNINVGKIDVTDSPGLSGRFMVTALPTIYHVHNGIFRQYKSPREKSALIEFVSKKTWTKVDPIPSWKSPTSYHMSILSQFFKLSQILRNIHNKLLEDVGLPLWGSYAIFALATIVLGTILGLFIVCLIDFIYPPKSIQQHSKKKQTGTTDGTTQEKSSDEDEIAENIGDDLVDEEESEVEESEAKESEAKESEAKESEAKESEAKESEAKESEAKESETKESEAKEVEASEKDKDTKADTSSPNVRKRKPRKAD